MTVGSDVKGCYLSVKNAEATLEQLMITTSSTNNKQVYQEAMHLISEIKDDLHQQVLFLAKEEPQY